LFAFGERHLFHIIVYFDYQTRVISVIIMTVISNNYCTFTLNYLLVVKADLG